MIERLEYEIGDYVPVKAFVDKLNEVISRVNSLQWLVESQQGLIELNREMIDSIQSEEPADGTMSAYLKESAKKEDVTPEPSQQVHNVTQGGSVCNPAAKREEQAPPQEPYFVGGKVQKLVSDNIGELFEDAPPEKEEETPYEELIRVLSNKEKKRVVKAYKKKVLDALYEQKLKETGQVRKTAFVDAFNIVDWID